ncbi:2-hydroxyacid dehydrogenase [Novosphingobium sp. MBES04]|uniref:2-hydroxyacid dehydrogenase n=1 Tax=Novosphingobium sp. MBES04 TaxID=1206458 RepID=UPI00057D746E|nr:2-hydroxyacid dehydrogenase [Novosphingobium sp. MBES04]GAM05107.1 D-2-hydroxyacid dehydrogenase [Novosphingobium sp. MBES04]
MEGDQKPLALQLCPFSPAMEAEIGARFVIERWFERNEGEQADWLAENGARVRAVVTGGHIGCPSPLMEALPELAIIAINGVGFDKVDLTLASARGVAVTTTPGVLTDDVADLAIGLVVALLRRIPAADVHVRKGLWPKGDMALARKVSGKRFGVLGLGQIGMAIARRLEAFGPVAYCDAAPKSVDYAYHADPAALAAASDVLVVACAATPATQGLVDAGVLEALGADGYLVNVARGSVIDERALTRAVEEGVIAGAALDVFAREPHVPDALIASERTVLTPHVASGTVETRQAMADLVVANLDDFLAGSAPRTALPRP